MDFRNISRWIFLKRGIHTWEGKMVIMEIWKNIHQTVSWDRGMGGVNYKDFYFLQCFIQLACIITVIRKFLSFFKVQNLWKFLCFHKDIKKYNKEKTQIFYRVWEFKDRKTIQNYKVVLQYLNALVDFWNLIACYPTYVLSRTDNNWSCNFPLRSVEISLYV